MRFSGIVVPATRFIYPEEAKYASGALRPRRYGVVVGLVSWEGGASSACL